MKLEEQIRKKMGKTFKWFEDKESGNKYRRVVCGVAFPWGPKPGYIVVLGEDLNADHSLYQSPHHIHLLAEFEHTEIEPLHRACLKYRDQLSVRSFYGNPEAPVYSVWQNLNKREATIYISEQHEGLDINTVIQLVKRHTRDKKTLHFGSNSRLPGYLESVMPEESIKMDLDEFPAVAALGRALAEIELNSYVSLGRWTPPRRYRQRMM